MRLSCYAALVCALLLQPAIPTRVTAATSKKAHPLPDEIAQRSSRVGAALYALDRAAWAATGALHANPSPEKLAGNEDTLVVEAVENGALKVTFYRGSGVDARAFFVADVQKGLVVKSEMLAEPTPLTPAQARLASARDVAIREAEKRRYKPCTAAPFKIIAAPTTDGGPIAVYLLSAQVAARVFPIGGAYRVIVSDAGKVLDTRPYSLSCIHGDLDMPDGAKASLMGVTHMLDPAPTEIHVFESMSMGLPLLVTTPEMTLWLVAGTRIAHIGAQPKARALP